MIDKIVTLSEVSRFSRDKTLTIIYVSEEKEPSGSIVSLSVPAVTV